MRHESLPFPAVSICNLNPYKNDELHKVPLINNLVNMMFFLFAALIAIFSFIFQMAAYKYAIELNRMHQNQSRATNQQSAARVLVDNAIKNTL